MDFKTNFQDSLFYLKAKQVTANRPTVNVASQQKITMDINVAHSILGHPDTKIVKMMASHHGWTLTRTILPCGSCALPRARPKLVPKSKLNCTKLAGEQLFPDISSPFTNSLLGNRYWLKIVDGFFRYSWDAYLPTKDILTTPLQNLLLKNKTADKTCRFLQNN